MRHHPRSPFLILLPAVLSALAAAPASAAAQNPVEAADSLFQAEAWPEAGAAYRAILAGDSTHALAWYRLGRVHHSQGRNEAALEAYDAASRHGFQPLSVAFARARSLVALGREDDAVAELRGVAESGFGMVGAVTEDPAFESLLDHPEMEAVIERLEENSEPCMHSDAARRFDFWIGTWDVYNPQGRLVGVNVVERRLKGCLLLENWTGASGSSGKSMNYWDPQRETWRQVWVSDQGNVLDYRHGEHRDGAMRFRGITIGEDGDTTHQRLTFEDVAPDTVRQVFEASTDRGETWNTTWVGIYVKRAEPVGDEEEQAAGSGAGSSSGR